LDDGRFLLDRFFFVRRRREGFFLPGEWVVELLVADDLVVFRRGFVLGLRGEREVDALVVFHNTFLFSARHDGHFFLII
jgi:hypothetical protein